MQVVFNSPDSLLASFVSGNKPGRLIIITGPSGSGKTRWCQALVEQANNQGIQVSGFVSPAVFQAGVKVGIDLLDLQSGKRRSLAVRRGESDQGQNTIDWHFNGETLDWGNTLLKGSVTGRLFILDELGPLEFNRGIGLINAFELLASREYKLACVVVRESLLEGGLALWPWAEVLRMSSGERSEVPA